MAFRRPAQWPTFAALVIALIALGVGAVGWFRPVPHTNQPPARTAPPFTDNQIADAKAQVCNAYSTVHTAVVVNTHRPNPIPGDAIGALAAAANGRLALYAGGDYLLDRLAAEPATPADLADAIRSLANKSKELAIVFLADEPDSAQDPLRRALDYDVETIDRLCK
jgi:hypothetical protein